MPEVAVFRQILQLPPSKTKKSTKISPPIVFSSPAFRRIEFIADDTIYARHVSDAMQKCAHKYKQGNLICPVCLPPHLCRARTPARNFYFND